MDFERQARIYPLANLVNILVGVRLVDAQR
jgi:hypothetical protein